MAEFFTLREDTFDFQFQLVDAIAVVVRGNVAQRFAREIEIDSEVMHANQLMNGFFMMQNKLQSVTSVFCNVLEYKQLGQPVSSCATVNGLFRKENLDALIPYVHDPPFTEVERDVFIPTRPQFQGDTGYIDLAALVKGKEVVFKIPSDNNWLQSHRWILTGQSPIPFFQSFKIFLPQKKYKTGAQQELTTTQTTVSSFAGSAVSTTNPNTGVVYMLPKAHSKCLTVYEEGYFSCSKTSEIKNPYSLCNNLPKICDRSTRRAKMSLLPTVLSTWSIHLSIQQGIKDLTWDAPAPATNLMISAKVKLRILLEGKKRDSIPKLVEKREVKWSENGCCDGNMYRTTFHNRKCETCPAGSKSIHRGLYCEINPAQ